MSLKLYNTLSRHVEPFVPLKTGEVKLYLCGPTVYDLAHIGNARPVVIVDVLHRLLSRTAQVTYVRNITDIDDKIIKASHATGRPLNEITEQATRFYHKDMGALGALPPTLEPKATEHVPEMIEIIQRLLDKGHAYVGQAHVLFDTVSYKDYGCLSRHPLEAILAGARVEVAPYKKSPQDFVLWKPSTPDQPGWESPWGRGRPGWHIECSAMSRKHLGETFDIHCGGQDLIFPHHENEIAQSWCAFGAKTFARYWVHNGMLLVNGSKMSKSLGNFYTVQDLLTQGHAGETIRFALLSTHYRQPLNWQQETPFQAKASLDSLYTALQGDPSSFQEDANVDAQVLEALYDDLNTPLAIARLHALAHEIHKTSSQATRHSLQTKLRNSAAILGLLTRSPQEWFQNLPGEDFAVADIENLIAARNAARQSKDFVEADRLRKLLKDQGILLEDTAQGTLWKRH